MGLSSQLAPSAIAKPGVCTSSTRPASPYEGQVIYTTDTDLLQIWNGTAWRTLAFGTPTNGTVLQVVTGSTATETTSTTDTTYKDTSLSASITPTSTTSKILVQVVQAGVYKTNSDGENRVQIQLNRAGSDIFDFTGTLHFYNGVYTERHIAQAVCLYVDSPSTTSSVTYKTRFRNLVSGTTALVQAGSATSTIVLQEIAA